MFLTRSTISIGMSCCENSNKKIGLQALFHLFVGSGRHHLHDFFGADTDGTDVEGGVVQDGVKLMGALNDMCLRFVLPFAKFAPEAEREKMK